MVLLRWIQAGRPWVPLTNTPHHDPPFSHGPMARPAWVGRRLRVYRILQAPSGSVLNLEATGQSYGSASLIRGKRLRLGRPRATNFTGRRGTFHVKHGLQVGAFRVQIVRYSARKTSRILALFGRTPRFAASNSLSVSTGASVVFALSTIALSARPPSLDEQPPAPPTSRVAGAPLGSCPWGRLRRHRCPFCSGSARGFFWRPRTGRFWAILRSRITQKRRVPTVPGRFRGKGAPAPSWIES